jgi:hypothetical protein
LAVATRNPIACGIKSIAQRTRSASVATATSAVSVRS